MFFKAYNLELDEVRRNFLDSTRRDNEFITSEADIIEYLQRVLEMVGQIAELLRTRFIFKTSERTNSGIFSAWIVRQTNITLNEAVAHMSDDMLTSARTMTSLHRRLLVTTGNFDVKGVSVGFIVDEFFEK